MKQAMSRVTCTQNEISKLYTMYTLHQQQQTDTLVCSLSVTAAYKLPSDAYTVHTTLYSPGLVPQGVPNNDTLR